MAGWDYTTDVVVVGSGGGLCGAVTAAANGLETLVIEKGAMIGGSTAMSGGVLWLPDNPLMAEEGVPDSLADGLAYFDSVVGDAGPASSDARRRVYIEEGANMVRFLREHGLSFVRCEGYSDYYAGVRGVRGGNARGRSIEPTVIDTHELGPWSAKLMPGMSVALKIVVMTGEAATLQLIKRSPKAVRTALRVAGRTATGRLRREQRVANGAALIAQTLKAALAEEVSVWTDTGLTELVVEDGRVTGIAASRHGRPVRIGARHAVLLASGGFARNPQMRATWSKQPNTAAWTSANPGDTGEVIEAAMAHGAAVALMDEAWWIPSSVQSDGRPSPHNAERSKPGSIVVDSAGKRYFNEAVAYMEAGQRMYEHGAIPSYLIMDSRYFRRYLFGFRPRLPKEWLRCGYMKSGQTLEDLASACSIDPAGLTETVQRFNGFARTGADEDFHRGEGAHERYQGDGAHEPNPCLGPLDSPPYYAVEIFPGDVGTSGGLLCDEHARVLNTVGDPIPGLYAAGNCTASVMGRRYPGAGASIGASFVFSYIAMKHAAAQSIQRDSLAKGGMT